VEGQGGEQLNLVDLRPTVAVLSGDSTPRLRLGNRSGKS
jgi:hypothetical protein